jgi:hypothetical protein
MAAHNVENEGRKNYYNVSYGKFSNKVKEVNPTLKEITEVELKQKTQAVENIDLRNCFINKGEGERPYVIYYDQIIGKILSIKKDEGDQYITLQIEVLDKDNEISTIQSKFYSKYSENVLNRLINADMSLETYFSPYSIPNESEIDGKKMKYYTQGISLTQNGTKIELAYKNEEGKKSEMPETQQIKVNGKPATSRDNRIDWLFDRVNDLFVAPERPTGLVSTKAEEVKTKVEENVVVPVEEDDLPW